MKKRWILTAAAGMLLLLLAALLTSLNRTGTDEALYLALEDQVGDYEYVGVSREETALALSDLAAYLRGEDVRLDREVSMFGRTQPVFNAREIAHMEDVLGLFRLSRAVMYACWLLGGALVLLVGWRSGKKALRTLLLGAGLSWAAVALFAGTAALIGFDRLFIGFHQLFFDNDLWLLDPRTDAMIRMLPQEFFERMALRVICLPGLLGAQALGAAAGCIVSSMESEQREIRRNRAGKGAAADGEGSREDPRHRVQL